MTHAEDDRLTSLPRQILINILSFLPTKFAVATAILSRPWRHLWTHITTLRFTITDFPEHKLTAIFFIIIRRVSWQRISAIELTINAHPDVRAPSSLTRLIHAIVYNGTNIKHLKVFFENYSKCTISLPTSIFKKQSLEVLEVYAPHGVSLEDLKVHQNHPNLRKLVISIREFDLQLFGNLLKSCPLLEILRVQFKIVVKFNGSIKINAQNLMFLSMNFVCEEDTIDKKNNKIMVDTPKLEYFEVHSPCMVKFCFLKTPIGLLNAKLCMGDGHPFYPTKHALSVFNPIFRVKTLKVSGDLLPALDNPDLKVEAFRKLSHLEMGLSNTLFSLRGVKCFLEQCPNVESLVLKLTRRTKIDDLNWPEMKFLPCCLHNKIQRIELLNFCGTDFVLPILRYIFSVAKALKKLDITIQINGDLVNLISSFEKA